MYKEKKKFFRRPSSAQILSSTENRETTSDFWENISSLKKEESITLVGKLFKDTPDEFLKRGPVVWIPTFSKTKPLAKPYELRAETIDAINENDEIHYAAMMFIPPAGPDRVPRRIRLNDILEAAKMYSYAPLSAEQKPFKPSIQIVAYDSVSGAQKIGASIIAKIPSRTIGQGKYTIRLDHAPISNDKNNTKYAVAYMITTDHVCEDKRHDLAFPTKNHPQFIFGYRFDAHEILVQMALIDYYLNPEFRKTNPAEIIKPNIIPLEMNLFGIPTNLICKGYDAMLHRVLIKETSKSKPSTLTEGHIEALLWEAVIKEGYKSCFFRAGEGKIKNFPWTTYLPPQ